MHVDNFYFVAFFNFFRYLSYSVGSLRLVMQYDEDTSYWKEWHAICIQHTRKKEGIPRYFGLPRSSAICDWIAFLFVVDPSSSQNRAWWNVSLFTKSRNRREKNETDPNKVFLREQSSSSLVLFLSQLMIRLLHHTWCHLQMYWVKKILILNSSEQFHCYSFLLSSTFFVGFLLVISTWTLVYFPGNGTNLFEAID